MQVLYAVVVADVDVGQPVVEGEEIFPGHCFGGGQMAVADVKEQFQIRDPLKNLLEVFVLVAVVRAVFHGHSHTPLLAVTHQHIQHLAVEFIALGVAQIGRPAHKVHCTQLCTHNLGHIDGPAQLIHRGLAHQRRGIVDGQIGCGVADDAQPGLLDGCRDRGPVGLFRGCAGGFDGQVDVVKTVGREPFDFAEKLAVGIVHRADLHRSILLC